MCQIRSPALWDTHYTQKCRHGPGSGTQPRKCCLPKTYSEPCRIAQQSRDSSSSEPTVASSQARPHMAFPGPIPSYIEPGVTHHTCPKAPHPLPYAASEAPTDEAATFSLPNFPPASSPGDTLWGQNTQRKGSLPPRHLRQM